MKNNKKLLTAHILISILLIATVAITAFVFTSCANSDAQPECEQHSFDEIARSEAWCDANGTIYYECKYCHAHTEESIAPIGHDWYEEGREKDCENGDYIVYVCSRCNQTKDETAAPTGHEWEETYREAPTCSSEGYINYECKHCGIGNTEYTGTTDHIWTVESVYEGNCQSEGYENLRCTSCYSTETRNLGLGNHDWQGTSTALCGDEGYFERRCLACNEEESGSTLMLEHDFKRISGREPTCYNDGWKEYRQCLRCNYNDYESIPATEHPNAQWVVTHKPTETAKGIRELHCEDCGDDFRVEVPESIYTDGLIYKEYEGGLTVVGIDRRVNPTATVIAVPRSYMGVRIYAIAPEAFKGNASIKSVDLSNSNVHVIGEDAFSGCTALESVTLGGYDINLNKRAFYGCTALKTLSLGENPVSVKESAFADCTALESITGINSVTKIESEAFLNTAIKNLELDGYIDTIGSSAFKGSKLESLTISGAVLRICESAFEGVGSAALNIVGRVDIIEQNAFKDSGFTSMTVSGNINSIAPYAFQNAALRTLDISGSIDLIGTYSFIESKLDSLTLSGSVTKIDANSFENVGLTSLDLSGDINIIEKDAFKGSKLTELDIKGNVSSIGFCVFGNSPIETFKITGKVKSLGSNLFENCTSLKKVELNDSVEYIAHGYLYGCSALEELTVPFIGRENDPADKTLNSYALADLFGGRDLSSNSTLVPKSLKKIAVTSDHYISAYAFLYCDSIETVILPDSSYYGEGWDLDGCDSLIYNEFEGGLYLASESNPYMVFVRPKDKMAETCVIHERTYLINRNAFNDCRISSISIPGNVDCIAPNAFKDNTYITRVTMEYGVRRIGSYAFSGCTSLRNVDLARSVTIIGSYAFESCERLYGITIYSACREIGAYAFQLSGLEVAYFENHDGWSAGGYPITVYAHNNAWTPKLSVPEKAAELLTRDHCTQVWKYSSTN